MARKLKEREERKKQRGRESDRVRGKEYSRKAEGVGGRDLHSCECGVGGEEWGVWSVGWGVWVWSVGDEAKQNVKDASGSRTKCYIFCESGCDQDRILRQQD